MFRQTALFLTALVMGGSSALAGSVSGTAYYRERIALPQNAVFTAKVVDISMADRASTDIGQVTINPAGNPPYRFRIDFDDTKIDKGRVYSVYAAITVDGALMFASDTTHRVLTQGAPDTADIVLKMVKRQGALGNAALRERPSRMQGMVTYMADAARFQECRTGTSYPIAMEGAFRDLQDQYRANAKAPGAALRMVLDATIAPREKAEGGSNEPTMIVAKVINAEPEKHCKDDIADSALVDTRWHVVSIGETMVDASKSRKEPFLMLASEKSRYSGTVGCNGIGGNYELKGKSLTFLPGISTLMACPPPIGDYERDLRKALDATTSWKIEGPILELLDKNGASLAKMRAVYLQ